MADIQELAYIVNTAMNLALVTTAETAILTTPPLSTPRDNMSVIALAWADMAPGTATVRVTPRIRKGVDTSGADISGANGVDSAASGGSNKQFMCWGFENVGSVAGLQYTLTLQQTSATANGLAQSAAILIFAV